ncbi:MAG TPA: ATP-dependent DNA ligase [Tepidisphaeraceae bacterium]|nr:ATP-dependent DNA ligase [Tepidisphaeraceae bacterium]
MSATLLEFARVNDAAAATTSKLQKQAILAEYFRTLNDDDLRRAVRFSAGRSFAATDERVTSVGGAIVSDVVLAVLKLDPNMFWDTVVKSGEIGEALSKLWDLTCGTGEPRGSDASNVQCHSQRQAVRATRQPLTLRELSDGFEGLASTGNLERKRQVLFELFSRCADPREAAYLAKIIFGDMRTGVQEGLLHYAIAEAFARDGKLVQRGQLLVGDLGEVAVLARHEQLADAQFKLFHPIQFMLATPQETASDAVETMGGRAFYAEDKLDGIRAQVHKSGQRVTIFTRTMDRADESFPDIVEAIQKLPGQFLLDGEIVPYRDGRVLPFAHIQKRLGRKVLSAKILKENPAVFIAFDILYRDGELLMDNPLRERRAALESLAPGSVVATPASPSAASGTIQPTQASQLHVTAIKSVATAEQIENSFCLARDCGNEGLILKDPDSPYSPGRRGQMWLKIKTHLPTLDGVVTAAEYGHGKRRNLLSDYTFAVWDRDPGEAGATLVNVGKAYSGVTDAQIAQLTELFHSISLGQRGHVHPVPPRVVLEIAFDQIQRSQRHASGYALRFPRIKRIRWDKRPEDADRLSRVIEIYESTHNFGKRALEPEPLSEPTLFDGLEGTPR